ncbi:hypothetical protein ABVT39_006957 [Epinephelus coioides]
MYEWDVKDCRVSGYLFDWRMVYLYTREPDELFLQGVTPHTCFSAKDWCHFRNKIYKELSTSKGVYTAQWNGSVSGKTYRVETDLEVYDPEAYIFFRQCMDNTVIHQARKGTPDEDKLYPLTPKEW